MEGRRVNHSAPKRNPLYVMFLCLVAAVFVLKRNFGLLVLTGHSEVTVLPEKVFSEYASYYTTAGVNLRSGPSTSYGKVQLVDRGTKIKAAAKEGNWTFVSVGSKFGWISSDYLSTKPPVEVTSGSLSRT